MNTDEAKLILGTLKAAYPKTFADLKRDDANNMVALWANMFVDDDTKVVKAAVEAFISTDTKGFPPAIGQIKAHMSKLTHGYQKTELEAWEEVRTALRSSLYHAKEEFDKLDPVIQRIVGSPSQLKEWAMAETGTPINVIASNFQRSYKEIAENQREYRALPGPVAEMVNTLAAAKDLNPQPPEPKALPVSVQATVDELKDVTGRPPVREIPPPLSRDDFEKKRAEILRLLQEESA